MRWNAKEKKLPKSGEIRVINRFVLTPTLCDKNHYHWLEHIPIRQWCGISGAWWDFNGKGSCPDEEGAK